MAFCEFSNKYTINNFVSVENKFIKEFMPNAPENAVKVYLYGLYKCTNATSADNTLKGFSTALNLSEEDVLNYFYYWEEIGLVVLIKNDPIEVRFLPAEYGSIKLKQYKASKYKLFNIKAQEIISGRMITPLEFSEYYDTIESLHIEKDAFLMIIDYCVKIKGNNVNYPYILTVAKNWAYEGLLTCEDIEERIKDHEKNSSDVVLVLKALKINRKPSTEEYQMYLDWIHNLEMNLDVIIFLAKFVSKGLGGFNKLNYYVTKAFVLKLNSVKEASEYFENEKVLFDLAKQTNKILGVRNVILENVVDNHFSFWQKKGFDNETILYICELASKKNMRNYHDIDVLVDKFYKSGLVTLKEIKGYVSEQEKYDDKIIVHLQTLGIIRKVNDVDRSFYNTWINDWKLSDELISYAIHQAKGTKMSMREANRILSQYFQLSINTVDQAKQVKVNYSQPVAPSKKPISRSYSAEEIEQGYDNIFEVEI